MQEGGTLMLAIDEITQFHLASNSNHDPTSLGKWVSMPFAGKNGRTTRVVTAYNPCRNNRLDTGTTYQQHWRYFVKHRQDTTCPRTRFWEDLIQQLKTWRDSGESLILCMDANKHIYSGQLGGDLTNPDGLDLEEPMLALTGAQIGPTHFCGSKWIDAIWVLKDLHITNVAVLPVGYGVGDHRLLSLMSLTRHSLEPTTRPSNDCSTAG